MATISERPLCATATDPRSQSAARNAVRWDDPEDVRLWIAALRSAAADAVAAGRDATRRPSERVIARAEARRMIDVADENVATLLDAGERCLSSVVVKS